jgi:Mg2+/Co2+ transporter CorB
VDLHLSTLFIILFLLIILAAFFAGTEIGMMSINRYKLKHLVKKNDKQAIRVNQILSRPDLLLSVVLIGNTLANIVASTIATLIGQRMYGDMGVAIATALLTLVVLVFSEMIPKTFAAIYPQQVAFATSLPLLILQKIFSPLIWACMFISNGVLRLFRISLDRMQKEALTGEELRSVVHEAGGLLPVEHKSMLISLLDLETATIEDIMIPKAEIVGIDLEQPWIQLLEQLETAQHTRLPLYRGSVDDLVGMIHVRDVLNLALEDKLDLNSLLGVADTPYYIPEGTPLNIQILNFRKMKRRSSFVVDEYGNILGLATMEDILEEIVGEFTTDIAALSRDIMPQNDDSVIIDGSVTLRHLNRLMGWQLPLIGPKTLSGLIVEYLGYIPPADSCLTIDNYRIEVLKVSDNTVKSVKVFKVNKKLK